MTQPLRKPRRTQTYQLNQEPDLRYRMQQYQQTAPAIPPIPVTEATAFLGNTSEARVKNIC